MRKGNVFRIPNLDGFILMGNGIVPTQDVKCFMELHIATCHDMWICVNVVDGEGFVTGEYTWHPTEESALLQIWE